MLVLLLYKHEWASWIHHFPALTLGKAEETMGHCGSKCKVSEEYGLTLGVLWIQYCPDLWGLFSHHCHYHRHRHHPHCDQPARRVTISHFHPPNTSPFSLMFLRE